MNHQKSENISRSKEIAVSFKYQFYSYLRTKRFLALALLVAVISIAILVLEIHRTDHGHSGQPTIRQSIRTMQSRPQHPTIPGSL